MTRGTKPTAAQRVILRKLYAEQPLRIARRDGVRRARWLAGDPHPVRMDVLHRMNAEGWITCEAGVLLGDLWDLDVTAYVVLTPSGKAWARGDARG